MEEVNINDMVAGIMGDTDIPGEDPTGFLQFTDEYNETKVLEKTKKFEAQWKRYAGVYEKKLNDAYASYRKQNIVAEGTSVKIPEIFALIEVELPHLINAIFGQSNIIDCKAKFPDPGEVRTYKIKSYMNNLIKDACDGEKKTNQIIKNELIYGTSFIKVYWDSETDQDIDPMSGQVTEINSSHANFDLVDPYTFAYDTKNESQDIQNCQWLRERIFISKEKMKVLRDSGACAEFNDDDMTSTENKGRMKRQKDTGENAGDDDSTYYDEYSATLYIEDEQGLTSAKEYIIWVLAGDKVIKFHPSKMNRKMYCLCRAYDMPNELTGLGEPDVIGALASHASYIHFQLGKTIKRVGQQAALLTPDANMSPEELRSIEDGVFYVDDIKGLSFQPSMDPENIKVLIESKEYIDKQIESVTGVGPALQGESIGDVTATEASYVFQNASNRLAIKLGSLQNDFMKRMAELMFLLTKQTLQEPVSFFDSNNNNVELQPQDFLGNYSWRCDGSISQANKALQLGQNTGLVTQMIQLVGASQNSSTPLDFNANEMIQGLISPYTNTPDMSRYVFPRAPMPMPMPQMGPDGQPMDPTQGGMQPGGSPDIQSMGMEPKGLVHTPAQMNLDPQAQVPNAPPHLPNIGNNHGAALRISS